MKAVILTGYGPPEMLQLQDVPTPTPKDNEVLIRNRAVTAGPSDAAFRKGEMFLVRMMYGFRKPRIKILGTEIAGDVAAVGKDVTQFKKGDPVFGLTPTTMGGFAEYLCVAADGVLVTKPADMPYADAAGVTDGGLTALTFLRDVAHLKPGQKILINGASGAVGAYAVQLARYYGADVTAVCSARNIDLVKSLGAHHVIDYTRDDFTQKGYSYDVIFDAVGKSSFSQAKRALTKNGIYMTTVPSLAIIFDILRTAPFGGKKAKFTTAGLKQTKDNLSFLKGLYESGKIKAVIDRSYPPEQIADAHRYVDSERKKGNVIITFA